MCFFIDTATTEIYTLSLHDALPIFSMWTGIPVFKLTEAESQKLIRMEDELHKRVIGQDAAIIAVSKAIRRARAGDRKSTRLNSSHTVISYAVFCLKKKKKTTQRQQH